ncbi:hypothetical protein ACFL0O_02645 [Thermodesulfobacteriota bacterium]
MAALDTSDRSSGKKSTAEKTPAQFYEENTAALKRVNQDITKLCDRFPLKEQREITELNRLMEQQKRLLRVRIKGKVPIRIETLNENEKYRAQRLQKRFRDAQKRGRVRG